MHILYHKMTIYSQKLLLLMPFKAVCYRGESWDDDLMGPTVFTFISCDHFKYINYILAGGIPTPLKNDGVKVSWDD